MTFLIILTIVTALGVLLWSAIPKRAVARTGAFDFMPGGQQTHPTKILQVATYNIHGAKGTDGVKDLNRTAQAIRGADIAALQEVHVNWRDNQAQQLANALDLGHVFVPTLRRWFRDYRGNGLLTRFPIRHWQTHLLPNVAGHRYRAYTTAEVVFDRVILSIIFTHLHTRHGRTQQLKIVLDHFGNLPLPAMLLGDLNTTPKDPSLLLDLPTDAIDAIGNALGQEDSPERIDWILTRGLVINGGGLVGRGASDHPYYWVEVSPERRMGQAPSTISAPGSGDMQVTSR